MILELRVPHLSHKLSGKLVETLHQIRQMNLRKQPSIAEGIDWAFSLLAMGKEDISTDVIMETLNVILKYHEDINQVRTSFAKA